MNTWLWFAILALTFCGQSFAQNSKSWSLSGARICMDQNNYINAHFKQVPWGAKGIKTGDIVSVTPSSGQEWICEFKGVVSPIKIRVDGWTENTSYVYRFAVFGTIEK